MTPMIVTRVLIPALVTFSFFAAGEASRAGFPQTPQNRQRVEPAGLGNVLLGELETGRDTQFFQLFESAIQELQASKSERGELVQALEDVLENLSTILLGERELEQAASMAARVLAIAEKALGPSHVVVANALYASAEIAHAAGEVDRAAAFATAAVGVASAS